MVCATIPPMPRASRDRSVVKSLVHASDIVGAFESAGDVPPLRDVVERTGLNKGMCFRLLDTLHQCGFFEKVDELRSRVTAAGGAQRGR
jgi:DNA-binding IclR family transcriptional regulator